METPVTLLIMTNIKRAKKKLQGGRPRDHACNDVIVAEAAISLTLKLEPVRMRHPETSGGFERLITTRKQKHVQVSNNKI